MITFPNAKINIGLDILRLRPDGYHDIDTVMMPVTWRDILEIVPAEGSETSLTTSGLPVDCAPEKNLVMKAFRLLNESLGGTLPPVDIYLHKVIPDGAGLGGGSADAAFTITALNTLFALGLTNDEMARVAAGVGADCPFFIYNTPMRATGTGTHLAPVAMPPELKSMYVAIAKPSGQSVSTARAYAGVTPCVPSEPLDLRVSAPVASWRGLVANAFEPSVGSAVAAVAAIKEAFYAAGAVYAAMSGSGSAVFGLFDSAILAEQALAGLSDCHTFSAAVADAPVQSA